MSNCPDRSGRSLWRRRLNKPSLQFEICNLQSEIPFGPAYNSEDEVGIRKSSLCLLAFLLFSTSPVLAEFGIGTRSLGMGGAFTAVADDSTTVYWNPAGLANVTQFQLQPPSIQVRTDSNLDWQDVLNNLPTNDTERMNLLKQLGSGVSSIDVSADFTVVANGLAVFTQPVGRATLDASAVSFAGDYPVMGSRATIRGSGLLYTGLSGARRVGSNSSIGVTLKAVRAQSYSETIEYTDPTGGTGVVAESEVRDTGVGMDLGYLLRMSRQSSFGLVVRNLVRPSLGSMSPDRTVTIGFAQRMMKGKLLLSADVENAFGESNVNVGMEVTAGRNCRLWAGVYQDKPTLGLGLDTMGGRLQFSLSPDNTSLMSGSLVF